MSTTYRIDDARNLVAFQVNERTDASELAGVFEDVLRDTRVGPRFQFISDRRGIGAPGAQYVREAIGVIRRYEEALGPRRWAIVIDADPATFEMGVLAESAAEHQGVQLRLFTEYDDALRWLQEPVR
jgi:hypothetical protein